MSSEAVRRAQLVAPFGVGAVTVMPDGTAVVTAGLDHWFEAPDGSTAGIDVEEFVVEEWRLQEALKVSHFRLPPDYRRQRTAPEQKNLYLRIPALRFPQWNFCPRCRRLEELPLAYAEWRRCDECSAQRSGRRGPMLTQVPFVAMCEQGHLQDFPFREWVHRELAPSCSAPLRLVTTGSASLGSQVVKCDCGASRTLALITEETGSGDTFLSRSLSRTDLYLCRGSMPWHGREDGRGCGGQVRASLRAASNLYFALIRSSIYLPRTMGDIPEKLVELLTNPPLSTPLTMLRALNVESVASVLRPLPFGDLLKPYSDAAIDQAAEALRPPEQQPEEAGDVSGGEFDDTGFRYQEFEILRAEIDSPTLKVRAPGAAYGEHVGEYFQRVMLVDQLRETRALWGFNRVYPEGGSLRERKAMLWNVQPDWDHAWLPAYIVKGEGIYLELDADRLRAWEQRPAVASRIASMASRYERARTARQLSFQLNPGSPFRLPV